MDSVSLICCRCQAVLTEQKVTFAYMGHTFYADVPCCPQCGQVYISESLARERMAEVETELEDK